MSSKRTKAGRRSRRRKHHEQIALAARRDYARREVAAGRAVWFNARAAMGVW